MNLTDLCIYYSATTVGFQTTYALNVNYKRCSLYL